MANMKADRTEVSSVLSRVFISVAAVNVTARSVIIYRVVLWPNSTPRSTSTHRLIGLRANSFGRDRKIAKSDYFLSHISPSVRPSVRSHEKTRLPLDGFRLNPTYYFCFLKPVEKISFIKIQQ